MKRTIFILLIIAGLLACNRPTQIKGLQDRVSALEKKLDDAYKPGFGEFMSGIQVHHNKLWFAGENQNWKLADFELHEIMEAMENIRKYQAERKESLEIGMILPALDSVSFAIGQKSPFLFRNSFSLLTITCNNCHRATGFEFNVVKIPDTPPFSNQDFKKADENPH